MQNLKIFLFLSLLFGVVCQGQSLKFGVKAGLNYANLTGSELKTEAVTNYHAGIVVELKLSEGLALQPELIYSTQGATFKTVSQDFKDELGYITIPIMVKINLSQSLTLELGPQAGFLLNEKDNFDVTKSNTFDFTANAGLGLKITNSLFAQGRYGLGLSEIKTNSNIRNSVLQLSIGYMF